MTFDWRTASNVSSGQTRVQTIDHYLKNDALLPQAPIDKYYAHRKKVITTATPEFLSQTPWLSGYLLVSLVSSTELYFRDIFSGVISHCSESQRLSAEKQFNMGSVLWHGTERYIRATFENFSLTETGKILSCSKEYLGFEIKKSSKTFSALEEFEKICNLRHGIVHSGAQLPGKNAVKLMAPRNSNLTTIEFGTIALHEAASVCTVLVESYNAELYEEMILRWATKWRQHPTWSTAKENKKLKDIIGLFFSLENPVENRPSFRELKNKIMDHYNLR